MTVEEDNNLVWKSLALVCPKGLLVVEGRLHRIIFDGLYLGGKALARRNA